ncbi:alpha/beta fold hydrolase [Brevibacterium album]|uniref:alpha/beta fold hydrolase n=1 Tax=Brevibacterium album TaxID=417948 RepID=UPI0004913F4E|nr:alpha/beta hydrolase [Brevibacterium album]
MADETPGTQPPRGAPHDNASVAARLAALPQTASAEAFTVAANGFEFSGYRAEPAVPEPRLGVAVLVHGWPQYASCWEGAAALLLSAGVPILAYDQRGYSPGARPDAVEDYDVSHLVADLAAVTEACGLARFHLVGHDWGGVMGWPFAAAHPDRLLTLTSVSTAHTLAHGRRMKEDPEQYARMEYLRKIRHHPEEFSAAMLRDGGARLAAFYEDAIPADVVGSYLERFSEPGVFDAVLKYYRALGSREPMPATPITVPTLYVWGSEDVAFTRGAAELTGEYVEAPYRFVEIAGGSHWLPEQHPDTVAEAVLAHVREHSGGA